MNYKIAGAIAIVAAWAMIGSAAESARGGGITLARDGRATAVIVTGKDDNLSHVVSNSRSDRYHELPGNVLADAAHTLADELGRMARIWNPDDHFKIVEQAADIKGKYEYRILLGTAAIQAHHLEKEAQTLPYPGYIYRVAGNDLLIFGSSSKGTANGVYGFLQDELGVRWFGPQPLFQILPKMPSIQIGPLDKRVVPSFPGRWFGAAVGVDEPSYQWGQRLMRMQERRDPHEPFVNASHNFYRIFPADQYYKTHPEYYAMHGGKRSVGSGTDWGICYSNPDVVDIATAAALKFFRASKFNQSFSLGINDTTAYCECDQCAKLQPRRMFAGSRVASDMYYHFVNEVARRVEKEFPDRYIGTIAYNDVTAPPLQPIEKNVFVVLVSDISEYHDKDYKRQEDELVRAWQAKGVKLGLYYYTGLAKLVPAYFPHLLASQLKEKVDEGFVAVRSEAYPGWPWRGPMAYVQARLMWDVNLNVDQLLDEYFTKLFGPAAKPMSRLYQLFEQIDARPRKGSFLYEYYKYIQFRPYTAQDLEKIESLLAEAHAAVPGLGIGPDPRQAEEGMRVAYVSRGLKVFVDMLKARVLAQQLQAEKHFDDVAAMGQLELIAKISEILGRHKALYRETILSDPFEARRYRVDTCAPVRNEWRHEVSATIGPALADLDRWAQSHNLDARVRAMLSNAVKDYTSDPLQEALFMLKMGQAKLGANLVANPGFEEVWGEGSHKATAAHPQGTAFGWSSTPDVRDRGGRIDTIENTVTDARFGRRSGRIQVPNERVYYLKSVPIKPDQPYLCQVEAQLKRTDARIESKARVYMLVRWFGEGWIYGHDYLSADIKTPEEWVRLSTVVIPPQGAVNAQIFLFVENLQPQEEALFDNLSVQPIVKKQ